MKPGTIWGPRILSVLRIVVGSCTAKWHCAMARVRAETRLAQGRATFRSSGTAASYLELCSTSDVLTLRTWGAAVRWVTKS